jgi:hypothetical protein
MGQLSPLPFGNLYGKRGLKNATWHSYFVYREITAISHVQDSNNEEKEIKGTGSL